MDTKHADQRIGIFIDVQNLYYSAKALYGTKVNFAEILNTATAGRKLVRAIGYTIKADMPEEQNFFDALEKLGIEVKAKELQTFVNGAKKGDWDVGIAVDILKMATKLDAVVLCSGDGDFQVLMHHAKAEGCRAEVISFGRSTSAKLIEEVDDFTDMDLDNRRYTLRPMNRAPQKPSQTTPQTKTTEPLRKQNLEDQVINAVNEVPAPPAIKPEEKKEEKKHRLGFFKK